MANTPPDILGKVGNLPQQITDVTDSICKGASKVDSMVSKMDAAVNNATTHNSISSAIKDGLSNVTGALKTGTQKANDLASDIQSLGTKASSAITPIATAANKIQASLEDLKNCQQVFATSSLLVNAIVGSVSGHLHSRNNEKLFSAFDSQWDSWAKGINKIYEELSPSGQANILGELAKCAFGDNVYALGSAVKNEAAGIFGGVADFEDAVHAFRGSYRNPIEAAKKIERGVKSIVSATERVANSINGMIEKYLSEMNMNPTGSKVLDYLGNLHNTRAVAAINKTLTLGGGLATLVTDVQGLQGVLKSKNPKAIVAAGKKTVNDVKKIIKELKKPQAASKTVSSASNTPLENDNAKSGSNLQGQQQQSQQSQQEQQSQNQSQQQDQRQAQQQNQLQQKNKANDIDSANADSYVCSGATMKCTFGDRQAKLTVYPDRTVFLTGQPMANVSDHTPLYNIAPFGRCHTTGYPATAAATAAAHGKLTPMPCVPGTYTNWMHGKDDYIIKGDSALLKSSFCRCCYGGVITITNDGQVGTGGADLSRVALISTSEMTSENKISADSVLDGIQLALDAAGFIPGLGAVPDILNAGISVLRGDFAGAGLNLVSAVPGIGDAVKAAVIAKKGLKSASAVSKVAKLSNIANKGQRRAKLAKKASEFIGTDVSATQLVKSGMLKSDADFFMKKVRYHRREAARKVYAESPNIDMFNIESHLNATNFAYPIETGVMPKGTRMGMYINKDIKGNIWTPGNYAFDISLGNVRPTTSQLAVSKTGVMRVEYDRFGNVKLGAENMFFKKEYHEVELMQDVPYVKSIARKTTDTWSDKLKPQKLPGGAEQIFIQNKNILKMVK